MIKQRRTLLQSGIVLVSAVAAGGGLYYLNNTDTRKISRALTAFLALPDRLIAVGNTLLDSDPQLSALSQSELLDLLLVRLDLDRESISSLTPNTLLNHLHDRVYADFVDEQISPVNGWVLSRTEAQLCALLALTRR